MQLNRVLKNINEYWNLRGPDYVKIYIRQVTAIETLENLIKAQYDENKNYICPKTSPQIITEIQKILDRRILYYERYEKGM